jgi:hypothetical protein
VALHLVRQLQHVTGPAIVEGEARDIQLPFIPTNLHLAGLDEAPVADSGGMNEPTHEGDGRVRMTIAAKKVVTLLLERK